MDRVPFSVIQAQCADDRRNGIHRISLTFVRLALTHKPMPGFFCGAFSQPRYFPSPNWDGSWLFGACITQPIGY